MAAAQSDVILREADRILESGLLALLTRYGEPHVIGSYSLRLMTWRDLDIHLVQAQMNVSAFFSLGGELAALLKPHRMHFRDETIVGTPGLPTGLYWGLYLGDEKAGAWKIDVWATDREDFESVRRFNDGIASRLTDETRAAILAVKAACWRHPQYRRGFTSADVYAAVLDRGVRDVDAFWADLKASKGIQEARDDQR
jgi:hypothetical protein